ncbi:uncharacterized protein EV154DRAFT_415586 [Mucor mucedo]|uniref:uncharacterized protein n=1 Tax=Mucor mucedo TaxID=29922 RepID=UPI00222050FB|nr:uncharacterized protein EV154DRAFT_415586 [Mucor mucedo]KAI7894081.1 hypothetical protein EV154DRAFT_415586 [Mucor mucedo]
MVNDFAPKTIHISSTGGGISHIAWTLEIGKVLAQRGHNVSFVTTDPNVKFGAAFLPDIKTISMGPHISKVEFRDLFDVNDPVSLSVTTAYRTLIADVYKRDFNAYTHIFETSNTALAICDQMALPCFDAAKKLNIPMILHITMSLSEDTRAPFITSFHTVGPPTTRDLSFKQRFYNRYIRLPIFLYRFYPVGQVVKKVRKEMGVEDFDPLGRHSNVIKMINSFWGMESPRPVGPFVEYVGPIISSTYDSLPATMEHYMNTHARVVYIAFGQMYTPNAQEFKVLLTSLLEAYESKALDGFIWSFSLKSRQEPDLPIYIQTRSKKIYNVEDLFDGSLDPNLRFEAWSPQFAILNHPHCKLFISHGGASSIHESLFNGVPLLLHPFTSDQPANAYTMKEAGVALTLDRKAYDFDDTVEKIITILTDKDGTFKSNMASMQALVQLKSRGKIHAADMIEEVLYSVRNKSDIWYRREESDGMPLLKVTNWDINLAALACIAAFFTIVFKALFKTISLLKFLFVSHQKLKTA